MATTPGGKGGVALTSIPSQLFAFLYRNVIVRGHRYHVPLAPVIYLYDEQLGRTLSVLIGGG